MDEATKEKVNLEMELARREVARKSHDTWRIYNPLEQTFRYMYDRMWHSVPAKSYKDVEAYLMRQFFRRIAEHMINQQIATKGEELKALREKQMGQQFLDHYEENVQIWDRAPKANDPDLIKQIRDVVIVGLVEEYGMEEPEPELRVQDAPQDNRSVYDQVLDGASKRIAIDKVSEPVVEKPSLDVLENILTHPEEVKKPEFDEKEKPAKKEELKPELPPLKSKLAEEVSV